MNLAATSISTQTSLINQQDPLQKRRLFRQVPHPVLLQGSVLYFFSLLFTIPPTLWTLTRYFTLT